MRKEKIREVIHCKLLLDVVLGKFTALGPYARIVDENIDPRMVVLYCVRHLPDLFL